MRKVLSAILVGALVLTSTPSVIMELNVSAKNRTTEVIQNVNKEDESLENSTNNRAINNISVTDYSDKPATLTSYGNIKTEVEYSDGIYGFKGRLVAENDAPNNEKFNVYGSTPMAIRLKIKVDQPTGEYVDKKISVIGKMDRQYGVQINPINNSVLLYADLTGGKYDGMHYDWANIEYKFNGNNFWGKWHEILVIYSGDNLQLYVDGQCGEGKNGVKYNEIILAEDVNSIFALGYNVHKDVNSENPDFSANSFCTMDQVDGKFADVQFYRGVDYSDGLTKDYQTISNRLNNAIPTANITAEPQESNGSGSSGEKIRKIELDTSSLSENTFQVGDEKQLPYSLYAESESKLKEMADSLSWTDEGGKLAITDGLLVMPTVPEKLGNQTVWRASSRIMITAKQAGKTTLIGKTSDGTTVKQEIEITSGSEENDNSGINYSTTLDKWLLDQGTSSAMNYLAKDKHFTNSEAVATFDSDFGFKLTEAWSNMLFRGNDGWKEIFTRATSREQARDILIALLEKQSEKTQELEDVETAHKYADIYVKTLKQANWAYAIDYGLNSEEIQYLSEVCVPDKIAQFFIDGEYSSISKYLKIKYGWGEKSKVVQCIESFEKSAKLADCLAEKLEWLDTGTKILSMTEDTINALYNVERLWKTDEMYSEMLAYIRDNCPFLAVSQAADDLYSVIHGGYMGAFSYASESIKNTFGGMLTDKVLDTLIDAIPWGVLVNTTYKFSVGICNIIFKINDTQKQKDNMRCVAYIGHYIGAWMVENRLNYLTGTTAEKNTYAKRTVYAYYMLLKTRMAGEESLQKMMNLAGTSWQRAYTVSKEISATLESNEKWLKNSGVLKNISTSVVACPVNVEIYDAAGKMVERVYDGKESEGYTGDIYYNVFYNPVADDYVKIIRLPADEGYSLKCEATDTGSVDYYFSAFDKDGNVVQKEIENIPVETGNSVQIPDTSGNRTECILKKGDDIEKEYIAQTVSEEYVAVTDIRTDITTLELKPGEKKRVDITILPENASAKAVTWTSSDSDVAFVNADGVITGIKTGNVVITAKAVNEDVSVQFSVKVTEKTQTYESENIKESENTKESEISSQKPTLKPDTSSQKEQITSVKVGDIIKTSKAQYRITATGAVKTAEYQKTLSKIQKNIKIPATVTINKEVYRVTSIAKNCFKGNKKLKTITISKNIKTIGANAFSGCKNLKKIKIASTSLTKKSVGKNVFKGIHKKAVIKVPAKKLSSYKKILRRGQAKSVKIKK